LAQCVDDRPVRAFDTDLGYPSGQQPSDHGAQTGHVVGDRESVDLFTVGRHHRHRVIIFGNRRWAVAASSGPSPRSAPLPARWRANGEAGLADHSSRPVHSPARVPLVQGRIERLRRERKLGPARIAAELCAEDVQISASGVHRVLVRSAPAGVRRGGGATGGIEGHQVALRRRRSGAG
jgi:hypothetical protein